MRFSMSDDEIRVSYNTEKDQKAQVRVLAELNATTQQDMVEKLKSLGCDAPDLRPSQSKLLREKEVFFDEVRARALFAEGKSDLEIAEMLGVSVYQFGDWSRKNGMKRNTGAAAHKAPRKARSPQPPACKAKTTMPAEVETPTPEPTTETAGQGSQAQPATPGKPVSAEAIGEVLLDLAKRYPGLMLTVNGEAVRSLRLKVRVMMNGEDDMYSTLDLEVG